MTTFYRTLAPLTLACAATLLAACSSDEPTGSTNPPPTVAHKYLVQTNNAADKGAFLTLYDSLPTGTINTTVGNTTQITKVMELRPFGKYVYTLANAAGEVGIQKYGIDQNGKLQEMGFIVDGSPYPSYGIVSETKGYYWDASRGKMKLQIFNPTTMARTGEVDLSSLSKGDPYESTGERIIMPRDGKLFVDIHYSDNASNPLANDKYDTAFAAVIDIATDKVEKVIKRPGMRGLGYVNLPMWDIDEKGDAYIISLGNFIISAPDDRDSKIIRIQKGSTDFDQNWSIDMNDYQRGGFFTVLRVRNGKLLTFYPSEPITVNFSNFLADVYHYHVIDIDTKVSTPVAGVPAHNFKTQCRPVEIDGKVYIPVSNNDMSGFYEVDGTTGKEAFRVGAGGIANMLVKMQ